MRSDVDVRPIPGNIELDPEFRLLAACSWIAPEPLEEMQRETIERFRDASLNWERFAALVERHRLPGIVFRNVNAHGKGLVPAEVREKLKQQMLHSWQAASAHAGELARLNKAFAGREIDLLPLKGTMLSLRLYNEAGMRQVRDLDLLVRKEQVGRASELLKEQGYRQKFPNPKASLAQQEMQFKHARHYEFVHERSGYLVELHWRWDMWPLEKSSQLWSNSKTTEWMGSKIRVLEDDALLLTVCDHGAGHRFSRLKWLSDCVMMLVQQRNSPAENLLALAAAFDMERPLAEVAVLARWLYGVPLAEELKDLIAREKRATEMAAEALRCLLGPEIGKTPHKNMSVARFAWHAPRYWLRSFHYRKSLRKRSSLRLALQRDFISPEDFNTVQLSEGWMWLYYPLRPVFWVLRHLPRAER